MFVCLFVCFLTQPCERYSCGEWPLGRWLHVSPWWLIYLFWSVQPRYYYPSALHIPTQYIYFLQITLWTFKTCPEVSWFLFKKKKKKIYRFFSIISVPRHYFARVRTVLKSPGSFGEFLSPWNVLEFHFKEFWILILQYNNSLRAPWKRCAKIGPKSKLGSKESWIEPVIIAIDLEFDLFD